MPHCEGNEAQLAFGMLLSRTIRLLGILLSAALCFPTAFAQSQSVAQLQAEFANARVRKLVGMTVENQDGLNLATVRDFVVDFRTGRITYAVLSSSSLFGLRSQLTVVPVRALSAATIKKRTLALDISKVAWGEAPRFRKKDLGLLGERTKEVQLHEFYGLPVPPRDSAARGKQQFEFASSLTGMTIINPQGDRVGKISGFLVDLNQQRPSMAIVSMEDRGKKSGSYAVPLKAISPPRGDKVAMDVTATLFQQARLLTPQAWKAATSNADALYRYE